MSHCTQTVRCQLSELRLDATPRRQTELEPVFKKQKNKNKKVRKEWIEKQTRHGRFRKVDKRGKKVENSMTTIASVITHIVQ